MSEPRIESYEDFWPYYLAEHRDPVSRRLHFLGTTGFFASLVGSAVLHPVRFPPALAGLSALLYDGVRRGEGEKPSWAHVAGIAGLGTAGSPVLFPAGMVFAYGCAWTGHFGVEKNRPATFRYPLWSLVSDFRMWSLMARGQLWTGDPLEELGLADPGAPEEPELTGPEVTA